MDMTMFRRRGLLLSTPHIVNESGSIVTFESPYNKILIKRLICNIEPIQEGSGDPSPENVRPISGRTGLSVVRTGKNLLKWENQTTTYRGVTFTVNVDGSILVNGTATGGDVSFYSRPTYPYDVPIIPGDYILSGCPTGGSNATYLLNETLYGRTDIGNGVTLNADVTKPNIRVGVVIRDGYTADNLLFKPMLRPASDLNSTYESYKGSTYSVNWESEAGTVYGGTLDVVSGKLVVDRAIVDLGTLNWLRVKTQGSHWRFYSVYNIMKRESTLLSSQYMQISPSQQYMGGQGVSRQVSGTNTLIMVSDERYEDAATFKAAMNGVQLVYELTVPTEIQLSGQEVKTLIDNSIWCDSGNVTVDYWKWGK